MSKPLEHDGAWQRPVATSADGDDPCVEIDALLEPYLDKELDPHLQKQVDRHVASCTGCAQQLRWANEVQNHLRALPLPSCPEQVSEAALRHARGQPSHASPPTKRGRWRLPVGSRAWQPLVALAAAVALALGLTWQTDLRQASPDPAVVQAEAEVKLALAYLGRMGEQTGTIVRDDVLNKRVASPVVRSLREAINGGTTP